MILFWTTEDALYSQSYEDNSRLQLMPNTHRQRRRDATRQNSFVASVVCIGLKSDIIIH